MKHESRATFSFNGGETVNQKIQLNFIWLSWQFLTVCTCCYLLVSVYWLKIWIPCYYLFSFFMWCGEKWVLITCGVTNICMCMNNHSLPGSIDCPVSHFLTCPVMLSFFSPFFSQPPCSPPCILLLATISPGLQLLSIPAHSPWNPPTTINIVWERSLGKHEPKGLISLNSLHNLFRNDNSYSIANIYLWHLTQLIILMHI